MAIQPHGSNGAPGNTLSSEAPSIKERSSKAPSVNEMLAHFNSAAELSEEYAAQIASRLSTDYEEIKDGLTTQGLLRYLNARYGGWNRDRVRVLEEGTWYAIYGQELGDCEYRVKLENGLFQRVKRADHLLDNVEMPIQELKEALTKLTESEVKLLKAILPFTGSDKYVGKVNDALSERSKSLWNARVPAPLEEAFQ